MGTHKTSNTGENTFVIFAIIFSQYITIEITNLWEQLYSIAVCRYVHYCIQVFTFENFQYNHEPTIVLRMNTITIRRLSLGKGLYVLYLCEFVITEKPAVSEEVYYSIVCQLIALFSFATFLVQNLLIVIIYFTVYIRTVHLTDIKIAFVTQFTCGILVHFGLLVHRTFTASLSACVKNVF